MTLGWTATQEYCMQIVSDPLCYALTSAGHLQPGIHQKPCLKERMHRTCFESHDVTAMIQSMSHGITAASGDLHRQARRLVCRIHCRGHREFKNVSKGRPQSFQYGSFCRSIMSLWCWRDCTKPQTSAQQFCWRPSHGRCCCMPDSCNGQSILHCQLTFTQYPFDRNPLIPVTFLTVACRAVMTPRRSSRVSACNFRCKILERKNSS